MAIPLRSFAVAGSTSSTWRERAPSAQLFQAVDCTWIGVGGFDHSILLAPDGCVDIVWNGARLAASLPRARGVRRRVEAPTVNLGLRLACGWAGALLGRALVDAPGPTIDLALLWGPQVDAVASRMRMSRDPAAGRALLEALVAERLAGSLSASPAVLEAVRLLRQEPSSPLDTLPRRLGMAARTLRRQVAAATGLSPKSLQRIFRFQAMRQRLQSRGRAQSAAELAADLGFADQAHMIRECRAMSGRTPAALRGMTSGGRNLQDGAATP